MSFSCRSEELCIYSGNCDEKEISSKDKHKLKDRKRIKEERVWGVKHMQRNLCFCCPYHLFLYSYFRNSNHKFNIKNYIHVFFAYLFYKFFLSFHIRYFSHFLGFLYALDFLSFFLCILKCDLLYLEGKTFFSTISSFIMKINLKMQHSMFKFPLELLKKIFLLILS